MKRRIFLFGFLCLAAGAFSLALPQSPPARKKGIIVRTPKPYERIKSVIRAIGGEVSHEFENIEAIAARIPENQIAALSLMVDAGSIYKDVVLRLPDRDWSPGRDARKGRTRVKLTARGSVALTGDDVAQISGVPAHREGHRGRNVVVAVVDSGVAEVAALSGSLIGGENLIAGDPVSATSSQNDPHGTQVAALIAAHAAFIFDNTSPLVQSLLVHDPRSVIRCRNDRFPRCPAGQSVVPMVGAAPDAKIYALKIFDASGSAPKSRLIAAMDRLITMRRNFERGRPPVPVNLPCGSEQNPCRFNSLNVQVANFSLGGPTLFAGGDVEDELTERLLDAGITPVVSAGNEGFAAMTVNSPATGRGAVTVGAANLAVRERVMMDQFELGTGILFRPDDTTQVAWFSSRGPAADGRTDPDLVAGGAGNYTQNADGSIALVEGTSFSSPTVAGSAAVLLGALRSGSVTATEVRNALIASADPKIIGNHSTRIDQGNGFIDVDAALQLLRSGRVSSRLPEVEPSGSVIENIRKAGIKPADFKDGVFSTKIRNLRPGEVAQFFLNTHDEVHRLTVRLRNISPELPPNRQNQLFGDDIFIRVADAPTSFFEARVDEFTPENTEFTIDEPQTGLVRVAIQGDWTNAGRISADLVIERRQRDLPRETAQGRVSDREVVEVPIHMPGGKAKATFELFWDNDWSAYPTNDLDLVLCKPAVVFGDECDFSGATLASPERVVVDNPVAGLWKAYIVGFTLNTKRDKFSLRVN